MPPPTINTSAVSDSSSGADTAMIYAFGHYTCACVDTGAMSIAGDRLLVRHCLGRTASASMKGKTLLAAQREQAVPSLPVLGRRLFRRRTSFYSRDGG
jgi:hypothetical protein